MPNSATRLSIRIVLVVVLFLAGGMVASLLVYSPTSPSDAGWMMEPEVDVSLASNQLTPEQVVELQVSTALKSIDNPDELKACYSLASPANRSFTGPYERFAKMVFSPPYHHLAECVSWQVGTAHIEERMAVVLVSVLAADGATNAYRFYLSKQENEPYRDCWMTDRVEPLTGVAFGSPLGQVNGADLIDEIGWESGSG